MLSALKPARPISAKWPLSPWTLETGSTRLQHVCRPEHDDVTEALQSPSLTVADDGRVYLRPGDGLQDKGGFLEFSSAGDRVAKHSWAHRSMLWNPATGGFWAVHWHDLVVVDEKGQATRTVARRADRKWLDWVSGAAVAPDGSIAVAAESNMLRAESKEWALNLYSSDGTPARMIPQPPAASSQHFAYDGRRIVVWQPGIRILDLSGKPVGRFKPRPGGKEAPDWPLLIAAQGRELWMFDAATKACTVSRCHEGKRTRRDEKPPAIRGKVTRRLQPWDMACGVVDDPARRPRSGRLRPYDDGASIVDGMGAALGGWGEGALGPPGRDLEPKLRELEAFILRPPPRRRPPRSPRASRAR